MSVDTYAICPCGSGKKIKFCKCKDSVHEMDKVLKMVEGGQVVPALDRLSSILTDHPDAAWALAIRGRLLISLQEHASLAENAERFIRLQPANPLALAQRTAAHLFNNELDQATEAMLEALTESGREVDAFLLDISGMLAITLAQAGNYLSALEYAKLGVVATGYEGSRASMAVLSQVNGMPTVNQLLKTAMPRIERPADVDWGERFDEAAGLLENNKVALAQSKLESLQRVAPMEPAVLQGLLTCAVWRGDAAKQSEIFQKMSDCESLESDDRAKYLAMSILVEPGTPRVSIPTHKISVEIQNADEVQMAMEADSKFVALPPQMLQQMRETPESVPPRAGFQILDREPPASIDELPPVDEVPEARAIVFVYGKTTDSEARVDVLDVMSSDLSEVEAMVKAVVGDATPAVSEGDPMPLVIAAQPQIAMIRYKAKPQEAEQLQGKLTAARLPSRVVGLPLPVLGGKSLQAVADDESAMLARTAVNRILSNLDELLSKTDGLLEQISSLANLPAKELITITDDQIEEVDTETLGFVDPAGLSVESLTYILQRAKQVSATACMRRAAKAMLEAEITEDEQQILKILAYTTLIDAVDSTEERLELLDKAKVIADQYNIPAPSLLLTEIPLRLQSGDADGFQTAMQAISTKHGNDPQVMAQLQQLLMSLGLIRPDGSPRAMSPAGAPDAGGDMPGSAAAGPGIWTPDGGGGPAPKASPESGGGSKLWVPGMD